MRTKRVGAHPPMFFFEQWWCCVVVSVTTRVDSRAGISSLSNLNSFLIRSRLNWAGAVGPDTLLWIDWIVKSWPDCACGPHSKNGGNNVLGSCLFIVFYASHLIPSYLIYLIWYFTDPGCLFMGPMSCSDQTSFLFGSFCVVLGCFSEENLCVL